MKLAETQVGGPIGNITINPQAIKHDAEKPRFDLIPPTAALEVAKVMTLGAKKYSEWNYLKGDGLAVSRYVAAAHRHINAFQRGEDLDPETGLPHLAHAVCCLLMCIEMLHFHPQQDDRFHRGQP